MTHLEILRSNEVLAHLNDKSLSYLLERGQVKKIQGGDFIFRKDEPSDELIIVMAGQVRVYVVQQDAQREVSRLNPGDMTGLLPYSRMTHASGYGQATKDSEVLLLHRMHFREMIADQHALTEALVQFMSSRIRNLTTINMQNEKLLSLGKLSAGLAHELNNPASAMVRSSTALLEHLKLVPESFKSIMAMKVHSEQVEQVSQWLFNILTREKPSLGMLERGEREDDICDQLADFGFAGAAEAAEELVDFAVNANDLVRLSEITGPPNFIPTLKWITDNLTTEKVVAEINASAVRIAELIQSIKRYSYMDQSKDRQSVDVNEGIRNTMQLLRHRMKGGKITLQEDLDAELPKINAFPGELNQVWTNLIDNALDAMEATGGSLSVSTCYCAPNVEVRIADTGEGIPEDEVSKIFDPFYTTKPIGKGTGLGLDIVSKIMQQHGAQISVQSKPGNTEFLIKFPIREKA